MKEIVKFYKINTKTLIGLYETVANAVLVSRMDEGVVRVVELGSHPSVDDIAC
jgi:hypothetical protein